MTSVQETPSVSRFAESLFDVLDRVSYRRVSLQDQFDPVYRLRYEAYRREEFVPINSQQVTRDEFDKWPNAFGFGIYIDDTLVSSLRLHFATPEQRFSPSLTVFPEVLSPMLDNGWSFLDPTRFTADRDASLAFPALPFLTLRIAAMACEYFPVEYCLSAVRPEHTAFYRRVFGSEQLSDERYFPGLHFPMCLYAARVQDVRDRVAERYPFFTSLPEERQQLFGPPGSASMVTSTARLAERLEALRRRARD